MKQNQPTILEYIWILFEPEPLAAGHNEYPTDFATYTWVEKGHGRIEERKLTLSCMLDAAYPQLVRCLAGFQAGKLGQARSWQS